MPSAGRPAPPRGRADPGAGAGSRARRYNRDGFRDRSPPHGQDPAFPQLRQRVRAHLQGRRLGPSRPLLRRGRGLRGDRGAPSPASSPAARRSSAASANRSTASTGGWTAGASRCFRRRKPKATSSGSPGRPPTGSASCRRCASRRAPWPAIGATSSSTSATITTRRAARPRSIGSPAPRPRPARNTTSPQ